MTARRKPAHWHAPEIIMLVRSLHKLGVRPKVIRRMTGVSGTPLVSFCARAGKHQIKQQVGWPGNEDLREAAMKLAAFVIAGRLTP
jgi:hypothetical protein